jgi:pyridoxine 4-dehydrogenase
MDWQRVGTIALGDGLRVRRLGFGGAWLTGPGTYGPPPELDAARRVLRRAVGVGIQLVDTADCYGPEISERLIAEALYPYPDDVVVSTKGGRLALGDNRWRPVGRPDHLRRACEASLRRLRLEAIDLYQLNAVDPEVPLEESLGALVELRAEGKVRAIGVCNVDVDQLVRARDVTRIASVQDRFDLLTRDNEPVLDACERDGIAFLPWFPPAPDLTAQPRSALERVARAHDARPAQVALAWLLARSPVALPLPGTPDPAAYEQDLAALELALDPVEVAALSETLR